MCAFSIYLYVLATCLSSNENVHWRPSSQVNSENLIRLLPIDSILIWISSKLWFHYLVADVELVYQQCLRQNSDGDRNVAMLEIVTDVSGISVEYYLETHYLSGRQMHPSNLETNVT